MVDIPIFLQELLSFVCIKMVLFMMPSLKSSSSDQNYSGLYRLINAFRIFCTLLLKQCHFAMGWGGEGGGVACVCSLNIFLVF